MTWQGGPSPRLPPPQGVSPSWGSGWPVYRQSKVFDGSAPSKKTRPRMPFAGKVTLPFGSAICAGGAEPLSQSALGSHWGSVFGLLPLHTMTDTLAPGGKPDADM